MKATIGIIIMYIPIILGRLNLVVISAAVKPISGDNKISANTERKVLTIGSIFTNFRNNAHVNQITFQKCYTYTLA